MVQVALNCVFPFACSPKNKYLRITKDENFSSEQHFLSNAPALAESACSYDLDQVDEVWLKLVNSERLLSGVPAISEGQFERVIEELEVSRGL